MNIHSANYQKKRRASDIFATRYNLLNTKPVRINTMGFQMFKKIVFSLVLITLCSFFANAEVQDSVGTKVKNGKVYIMHKVEKGQGMYSIGRRYNVPYKKIIAANPGSEKQIIVGQIILVPTGKLAPMEEKVVKEYFEENKDKTSTKKDPRINKKANVRSTFAKFHTVKAGETLYAIAQKYNTETKVIVDLNEMQSTDLSVGQKILVPVAKDEKGQSTKGASKAEKKLDDLEKETKELKERVDDKKDAANTIKTSSYKKTIDVMPEFDVEKITETGNLHFSDENELNMSKKVASHHEAKIGTTIMVTNPTNNKAIFVKVVKNHSMDTEKSNMIIIPSAIATKIGIQNGQSVTTSYAR